MSSEAMEVRDAAASYAPQVEQDVPPGYKRAEVGVIPEDWESSTIGQWTVWMSGGTPSKTNEEFWAGSIPWISGSTLKSFEISTSDQFITEEAVAAGSKMAPVGSVLVLVRGSALHNEIRAGLVTLPVAFNQDVKALIPRPGLNAKFLTFYILAMEHELLKLVSSAGNSAGVLDTALIKNFKLLVPPVEEQRAIKTALSDVDTLITALDRLIAKKRAIKTAAMQQLLTGKTRLPGFTGEWETKVIEEIAVCLDNLRVPLNEKQRSAMPGPYPYCGANGVLDYVNGYVIDDDVILIAEDGGYFDEYAYRPIAYRMTGKIWVNNHAHVLKAKSGYSQGFLYFSLVHKNILPYLASGTRAKLNRSEMNKIEVFLPVDFREQESIAQILSDMDAEIAALEARRDKTRAIKQGMMQQLLTGRVRLLKPNSKEAA